MNEERKDENDLLTYEELGKKLGLCKATLQRRVNQGKLPHIKLGHQVVRFHYPTVLAYLSKNPID